MSGFYVGQRVRIVGCEMAIETLGKEGSVVAFNESAFNGTDYYTGFDVDVDGIGVQSPRGWLYCFPAWCLEPIVPNGHQAAEMDLEELLPFLQGVPA